MQVWDLIFHNYTQRKGLESEKYWRWKLQRSIDSEEDSGKFKKYMVNLGDVAVKRNKYIKRRNANLSILQKVEK